MKKKHHSEEQIVAILREADEGRRVEDVCRDHNISKASFHRWKSKYGQMELLDKQLSEHRESSILERKILYAAKTRETMRAFKALVLKRKVEQIENEILDCFNQLLRKQGLVHSVKIDPVSYTMTLQADVMGTEIPTDRLSAGERQLLAISTLWGLPRVSGRPLPNIIDTPLGRLDSKHRVNLVDNYFPNASHQVIILSTDEEINGSYYERLKTRVGLSYELCYDDETKSTVIQDGYFFN